MTSTPGDKVFEIIAHGDEAHRAWLREKSEEVAQAVLAEVVSAAYRVLDAFDICDGNRGWLSCVEPHDGRCHKARAARPEDWKGEWVCECGAQEFADALIALTGALGAR